MGGSLERREDGSVALLINGDLQFDSRDERIYHECIALPALAVALSRNASKLKALIIGGGDGLTARELLKSSQLEKIDLVDYDPEIIKFAGLSFRDINEGSLENSKVQVHIQDAWGFVESAIVAGEHYDLIISDLTVPEDIHGARFHTIDWYTQLRKLLSEHGILAVNACSPNATPRAYCSILNGLLKAGLHTRPLHATIPSFREKGYGEDWGFFIASPSVIQASEVMDELENINPRTFLVSPSETRKIFEFPSALLWNQAVAAPANLGSDILLVYFNNDDPLPLMTDEGNDSVFNALNFETSSLLIPEADSGSAILPQQIKLALSQSIHGQCNAVPLQVQAADGEKIFNELIQIVPALDRVHTPELVADFLRCPAAFLQDLDLSDLINRLLARGRELPATLVQELEQLKTRMANWAEDNLTVLGLSHRLLTLLTLVIVLGNLLYPDMVYAKGHSAAHEGTAAHSGANTGVRRGYGYGTGWNNGVYNRRYVNNNTSIIHKPINDPHPLGKDASTATPQIKQLPKTPNSGENFDGTPQMLKDDRTRKQMRLEADASALFNYGNVLKAELASYEASSEQMVTFGVHSIARDEAIRKTNLLIARNDKAQAAVSQKLGDIKESLNDSSEAREDA